MELSTDELKLARCCIGQTIAQCTEKLKDNSIQDLQREVIQDLKDDANKLFEKLIEV